MKLAQAIPVCLALAVPGAGQIALGRPARGILIFFLFGFAVDAWFYSQAQSILPPGHASMSVPHIRFAAIALGALLWAFGLLDTLGIALRHRRIAAKADLANAHVRDALVAHLRGDPEAARKALLAAHRINDQDPDTLFHLGVVYATLGQPRKARRVLHRCIRYDDEGKWDNEARERLLALDGKEREGGKVKVKVEEEGP